MAIAIVTAGAGARGAFEAGVLSVVLPALIAENQPIILLGTSAGALNAALIAGAALANEDPSKKLEATWCGLDPDKVFTLSFRSAAAFGVDLAVKRTLPVRGLFDTSPLAKTVDDSVKWPLFERPLEHAWLKAVGVVATQAATGTSVACSCKGRNYPRTTPPAGSRTDPRC
jgi:NTE family protein